MKRQTDLIIMLVAITLLAFTSGVAQAAPMGNAFTYQGQIKQHEVSVNGSCDLWFQLFDAATGGSRIGIDQVASNVSILNGLFSVILDFGAVFSGNKSWLEIQARCPSGGGSYETLSPRQELTALPHAAYALKAGSIPWSGLTGAPSVVTGVTASAPLSSSGGTIPNLSLTGTITDSHLATISTAGKVSNSATTATSANTAGAIVARDGSGNFSANFITASLTGTATNFSGSLSGDVTGTQGATNVVRLQGRTLASTPPASGQVLKWNGSQWAPGTDDNSTSFWSLAGNAGTTPGTHFLGTTDNNALEFKVSGERALRLEPYPGQPPNVIGGFSQNMASPGFIGITIAGGGESGSTCGPSHTEPCYNRALAGYAAIGGGIANTASGGISTVSGGQANTASSGEATVSGGYGNTAQGDYATVSGGFRNTAGRPDWTGDYSNVSGGRENTASGEYATVPGGNYNRAYGGYSFAAGNQAVARSQGSFVWADSVNMDFDPYSEIGPQGVNNSFNVRASGGVFLVTSVDATTGNPTNGMYLYGGGSGWNAYSDPAFKRNIQPVDGRQVLAKLATVPVNSWNYISQDPSIRHIGPMAPDFNAAFGVGEPDKAGYLKYINSIDADGVALAAIQGLYQLVQEKDEKIASLEARNVLQQEQIDKLQKQVDRISAALEGLKQAMTGSSTKFMVSSINSGDR